VLKEVKVGAKLLAAVIDALITSVIGVFVTLYGYGLLGRKRSVDMLQEDREQRNRKLMRVLGPVLIGIGLIMAMIRLATLPREADAVHWARFTTDDGVGSAEFPAPPERKVTHAFGVEATSLILSRRSGAVNYRLTVSDISPDAPKMSPEERLDVMRDMVLAKGAESGLKYEFIQGRPLVENGVPGREMEFGAPGNNTMQVRAFIHGSRIYRVIAVTPTSSKGDEETRRFLTSVRLHPNTK
jgi:hypothetical protein